MNRFIGTFLFVHLIFSAGCFSNGEDAELKLRSRKECKCAPMDVTAWQKRDTDRTGHTGGEINIGIESEPGLLLSMYSAHPAVSRIIDHDVLEALVDLDSHTGEPVPELASRWESDAQQRTYTFQLVNNGRWHDGQPFTADDVVYTFEQLLDPAGGALNRSRFEDIAGVEALNRYQIRFQLDYPRPNFLADISRVMILPEHLLRNTTVATNPFARAPVGTGPFVFHEWTSGHHIVIEKNAHWRGKAPYLDRITYRTVPERRVAEELFSTGRLDIVSDVMDTSRKDAIILNTPQDQLNAWVFNVHTPYFSDAETRRAISMLFDRDAIACSIMNCLAKPVYSPWPEIKTDTDILRFSPTRARQLLNAAGWRDENRDGILERQGIPFSFSLLLPDTDAAGTRAVAVILHDLRRIGIQVNTTVVSWAVYTDRLRRHRFDASILAVSTAPPFDAAELFHSDGIESGRNFGGFRDRKTDMLFDRLKVEQDINARDALQHRISERLVLLQPMIFTLHPYRRILVQNRIHGVHIGSSGIVERELWTEAEGSQQR